MSQFMFNQLHVDIVILFICLLFIKRGICITNIMILLMIFFLQLLNYSVQESGISQLLFVSILLLLLFCFSVLQILC